MSDLQERLRATDPARDARPLDEAELVAMRRAMHEAHAPSRVAAWRPATALAVVLACLLIGVLLWPSRQETPAPVAVQPFPVVVPAPPPVATAEAVEVARPPRKRYPAPMPDPAPATSRVKEIRFVTASGTQILWTFHPSEEGA